MKRFARMIVAATVLCIALLALSGCQMFGGLKLPPDAYIQQHAKYHTQYGPIVKDYNARHPDEAQEVQDLYDSEGVLIDNAKKGQFPAAQ